MSLLMEALRKAEEAKRKDGEEIESGQSLGRRKDDPAPEDSADTSIPEKSPDLEASSGDPISRPAGLQTEFDAALTSSSKGEIEPTDQAGIEFESSVSPLADEVSSESSPENPSWQSLDLHPITNDSETGPELEQSDVSEEQAPQPALISVDNLSIEDPVESVEAFIDDYAEQENLGDQEDKLEAEAWKSRARKLSNPRDYRTIGILLLVIILFSGGALFWFLNTSSEPVFIPEDRGFLGGEEAIPESGNLQPATDSNLGSSESGLSAEALDAGLSEFAPENDPNSSGTESFVIGEELELDEAVPPAAAQDSVVASQISSTDVFRITPSTRSSDLNGLQTQALQAALSGYDSHAREQYQWLLTAEPNNKEALLGLARLDKAEGNIEAAQASYIKLLELDPTDLIAQAGLLNLRNADSLAQEAQLKSLVARFPEVAPLSFVLGNLLASQQRWNEALGAYSQALASAKADMSGAVSPDYPFNLAVALERLNKTQEAYVYYQEAMQFAQQIAPGFDIDQLNRHIAQLGERLR